MSCQVLEHTRVSLCLVVGQQDHVLAIVQLLLYLREYGRIAQHALLEVYEPPHIPLRSTEARLCWQTHDSSAAKGPQHTWPNL